MVEDLTFNKYLKTFESTRLQYELDVIKFEDRQIYIPQKYFLVSFTENGRVYTQKNITPFTIPLYYLN